jgi:ferredoxin
MTTVQANRDTCQGYGNCVIAASDHFDIDDDGLVVVLNDSTATEADLEAVRRAAYDCPTSSITVDDTH